MPIGHAGKGEARDVMEKRRNRIVQDAREALAIARGEIDPSNFVVHVLTRST